MDVKLCIVRTLNSLCYDFFCEGQFDLTIHVFMAVRGIRSVHLHSRAISLYK